MVEIEVEGSNTDLVIEESNNSIVESNPHAPVFPYIPSDVDSWEALVFSTPDEAYSFYDLYSKSFVFTIKKAGFVKRDSKNKSIDYPYYLNMACHREGFKVEKTASKIVKRRKITRTGCKAAMKLKIDFSKEGYAITQWIDHHNHPLIDPDKRHFLPHNRRIQPFQKYVIDNHMLSGISQRATFDSISRTLGVLSNIGFLRKDLKNYISTVRQKSMAPSEATVLLNWFREQAFFRPGFYYEVQVDNQEQIASIFWADSMMRADYAFFSDLVSFDPMLTMSTSAATSFSSSMFVHFLLFLPGPGSS